MEQIQIFFRYVSMKAPIKNLPSPLNPLLLY